MNIVVIGGTRFTGMHVVRQLAEAGRAVSVSHRGEHEGELLPQRAQNRRLPGTQEPSSVRHVHRPEAAMPVRSFPAELLTPEPDVVIHMMTMGEADTRAAVNFFRGHTAFAGMPRWSV